MQNLNPMNWLALQPEIWLLAAICVIAIADLFITDPERRPTFWLTQLAVLVFSGMHFAAFNGGETTYAMGGQVVTDPMGHLLAFFAGIAMLATVAYARPTLASRDMLKGEFYVLALMVLLGISVMTSANSFLVVYLGLELMSLSLYALAALRRDHAVATEAAMKYFVLGALASGFLLYGLSMMYGATGSLEIPRVFEQIATNPNINREVLVFGVVFVVAGVAFKLGAAPFHMWVPDVYQGAPTSVTLLIGGAPKFAAFAITIRLLVEGMLGLAVDWQQMFIVLAVASLVVGNVVAIAQTNLKRMLAYSTIAQMGFILLGMSAGVVSGNTLSAGNAYSSSMFYVVAYVLTTLGTFGLIMVLSRQGFESEQIEDLAGLGRRSPWIAGVMSIFMFSLAGLPPMVGFYAKLAVLQAMVSTNVEAYVWLAVFAVMMSLIGAFYYLRVVKVMYFDEPKLAGPVGQSTGVNALLAVNGLAVLVFGLLPGGLMAMCRDAIVKALSS
ncbi:MULTISPECIES: NADH-quinone oxidoreductase subunit NuoN [Rubrivivax]|uniref:NADH-quinone oxidoreductase subunit N n=1 Tax=Rubrivivax benzoatilyticus TaxID=316997 RepID=A0ABX0HTN8_9BURK|nr:MULTISPECIES: NADH-quinone oxidoreductase subunit NuoN [Rubrivivax]EGJ11195.1 NADH:ubiquinone oxidoreductase subunit N [Rubrivivax benzoatilyticus JA2 = ATCC BAA-35]MCD0418314.1 NADH-quinone oxidoreductase subunit NuoN [Rubrivivax sp. JA1024]NHK97660.1 NADH-quinone oxidoreductase subunit NuoN [Rubrivivax benzoatilyticus]NHL22645.1 NADH-quinone oxidoreductase subunit NuoN [Rubrivivax benzoatilyticus]